MRHPRGSGDPVSYGESQMDSRVRGNDGRKDRPRLGRGCVIPAEAGIQCLTAKAKWIPACAGMTAERIGRDWFMDIKMTGRSRGNDGVKRRPAARNEWMRRGQ